MITTEDQYILLLMEFIDAYYNGASPEEMEDLVARAVELLDKECGGYGAGV